MKKRLTAALFLAGFGLLLSAALFPPVLSLWPGVLAPAMALTTPTARLTAIERLWAVWLDHHSYLPWNAWPVLATSGPALLAWLVLTTAIVGLLLYAALRGSRSSAGYGGPPAAGKGQHGTARWRGETEIAQTFALWRAAAKEPQPSGIYLGAGPTPGSAWLLTSDQHVLLVGSPGSGKSRGLILPTIGVIGSARTESMLISDPKGELYAHTAAWLRLQGYEVVRFDLREPARGSRWNPVRAVVQALAEGRRDQASAIAWDIAHVITFSVEHKGDMLWPQAQEALISSLILALAAGTPPRGGKSPEGEEPWRWPTSEQQHMGSVYAALLAGGAGGGRLDDWIQQFPPDHPAYRAYGPVRLSVERTRASILTGAAAELRLFADDEIAWLTADQDHDLADLGRKPTAVFLVIPDERSTRYPLATLYVQQTLQSLAALADASGGRLPVQVNVLLDEFGNLPQIRDFDKTVAVSRSRGIRLLLAVQDLAQIKRHYGEAANTIKGSTNTWIYLRTAEIDTAREIAAKLGRYTVAAENMSVPRVTWWTTSPTVGTASTTHTLQARELLTPDEVLRWPPGQALVMQAGQLPARLPLPDLSAWAKVWPNIQTRTAEPPASPVAPPAFWRPPDLDGEGGEAIAEATVVDMPADVAQLLSSDA